MGRILCIDYGSRKSGLAVTDPLGIIVNGLETVETSSLFQHISEYIDENEVDKLVIGYFEHPDGTPGQNEFSIAELTKRINNRFPDLVIDRQDEGFSSEYAKSIILRSGVKKKKRRNKELVDKISAVVILQRYLGHI